MKKIINKKNSEYQGLYKSVNKSFGFVLITLNDKEIEVYVKSSDSLNAMDNDKVLIKIQKEQSLDKKAEGKIIKIVERNTDTLIGIFSKNKGYGFVTPINGKISFDVHIEKKYFNNAVDDSIVLVKILNINKKRLNPEGVIIEVIGHKDDPNAQILSIVREYKVRDTFPDEVIKEANSIKNVITDKDLEGRRDLRNITTITIDGEDAKDLDDAVSFEELPNGNKLLYVSIADVSHYVKENSYIDKEALKRGNSVYLIDRVIPMIPHVLSNGMCSLNECEDRLTLTCEMEIDNEGRVVSHQIYKSVINSNKRMSYNGVHAILNNIELTNGENIEEYKPFENILKEMLNLSIAIRKRRYERGAIEFNFKESKIIVDENLVPIDVIEVERNEAHKMIEDFMLIANETVAEEYYFREVPFIYRTHEECDNEKMKNLSITLANIGVQFTYKEKIHPKEIQKLLERIEGTNYQYVVERLTLRSMKQARYTKEAEGHFALAAKYYCHFTSPIRRYPDLQIHRIIKETIDGLSDSRRNHYESIVEDVALKSSLNERKAIDLERDVEDLKKCEYMKEKIGKMYEGNVSGLTNFGIFVELKNGIEGMIALRDMHDDHYNFDEVHMEIIGEHNKKEYHLGDKIKVQLAKVVPEMRIIDFILSKE